MVILCILLIICHLISNGPIVAQFLWFSTRIILSILLIRQFDGSYALKRQDDICGNYNGRRLYLDVGEHGILTAQNIMSALNNKIGGTGSIPASAPGYTNTSSHEQCRLELITCPSCVLSITFQYIGLPHSCGGANLVIDSPCRCDYVWISEPPYEDVSGTPICGVYTSLPSGGPDSVTYKSHTRTVTLVLLYSESHSNAFTLEYSSERNKKILKGSPGGGSLPSPAGNVSHGGILKSPFFPSPYPRDLGVEYVIACEPELTTSCRVRVLFRDFQLGPTSIMEFYDGNGQRLEVSSGAQFRPPIILSTGPSLLIRFYANGGTGLGYKAVYSFVTGNILEKTIKPITDCGGVVENFGGAITMMNMVTTGVKTYDCVWIIRPPKNYLHLKTHLYLKVATFMDMAGNTELEVLRGITSDQPLLETLRHPVAQLQPPRHREHVVPVDVGFYVSLRGTFGPTSRLAIVYTAFSYMDCFTGSDTLCQNHRCIPSQLYCDGFDHCGDNSDEPTSCYQDWKTEPHPDRHWYSHTPNYYFPKMERYPDLKTATLVFVVSSLGLILLIAALIILLYRMGARARQQRELQNHLQTISELLDGARIEEIVPDDPPVYEAPPDYDEVIKVFPDLTQSQRRKRKHEFQLQDPGRGTRSNAVDIVQEPSSSRLEHRMSWDPHLEVTFPSTPDVSHPRYMAGSAPGLLIVPGDGQFHLTAPSITSRSCQTTPIPDSPPPSYVASMATTSGTYSQVPSTAFLVPSYNVSQLVSPNNSSRHHSKKGRRTRQAWLLFKEEESSSRNSSDVDPTLSAQENQTDRNNSTCTANNCSQNISLQSSNDSDDCGPQQIERNILSVPQANIIQIHNSTPRIVSNDMDADSNQTQNHEIFHQRSQSGDQNLLSCNHNSRFSNQPGRNFESCQSLSTSSGQWTIVNLQTNEQRSLPQSLTGNLCLLDSVSEAHLRLKNQYEKQFKVSIKNNSENSNMQQGQMTITADEDMPESISLPEKPQCTCEGACGCVTTLRKMQMGNINYKLSPHMRSMSLEFPFSAEKGGLQNDQINAEVVGQRSVSNSGNSYENVNNGQDSTQNTEWASSDIQSFLSNTTIIGRRGDVF